MSSITASRRRQHRYSLSRRGACVEFEYPNPNGCRYRLPLVDISCAGLSFTVEADDFPSMETGTSIVGAVVRIGECMIRGDLMVMHVTEGTQGGQLVCGALLYPDSDTDLIKLKSVIAGMESVETP